jgi:hypothetical protein
MSEARNEKPQGKYSTKYQQIMSHHLIRHFSL